MKSRYLAEALRSRRMSGKSQASWLRAMLCSAAVLLCAGAFAGAQTVSTVYNFVGGTKSGANPWYVTLVQGSSGALYGTTYNGGSKGLGTFFSVTTSGTFTLLHSFAGGASDGANPSGGLTLGTDGNFYGTTQLGGTESEGVVFKMTSAGTVTVLHSFNGATDGAFPWSPPIEGTDGNFYGATAGGVGNDGIVYKVTTSGTYTTILKLTSTDGSSPVASPVQGLDGYLYIPVSNGGTDFCGTVLQVTTAGVLNNSFDFPCGAGGAYPIGPLVQNANGDFYSTTQDGGTYGQGTVYQLTTGLAATVLYSFGANSTAGEYPSAGLLLATDNNYYGATAEGGTYDDGTLFNISTSGTYKQLYSFNNSANLMQMSPLSPPVQYTNGELYGVTQFGGTDNLGTVYSLNMGLAPFVNTPVFAGREGSSVLILGNHLTGASEVSFEGSSAKFKVNSDTQMTATVPIGATSGWIRVITPNGVVKSRKAFQVIR
jgi:uncharacterized repeat protein (TIGR03803 family)